VFVARREVREKRDGKNLQRRKLFPMQQPRKGMALRTREEEFGAS